MSRMLNAGGIQMLDGAVLSNFYEVSPPADDAEIGKAEQELGFKLPKVYKELLHYTNGFSTNDGIGVFGTDDIVERNRTYEVQEYAPGFVGVGSDGGDDFFIMAADEDAKELLKVDCGCMNLEYAELYAKDFLQWVNEGAPDYHLEKWRKEKEEELNKELCDIVLVRSPERGAEDLRKLQEIFKIRTGLFDLLKGSKHLPFVLLKDACLNEAKRSAAGLGELAAIIELVPTGSLFDRCKQK